MTRREDAIMVSAEQSEPPPIKQSMIATWLSEFEEKIAADFRRRTDLDYKTTIAEIIKSAEPFLGMQVLDAPTGTGIIARQFVGKVGEKGRIIGVDETDEKIRQARLAAQSANLRLRIEWGKMPVGNLKFADASFDLVTSVMAFHRLQSETFLAEACRVLKPGGRMLIADELAPAVEPHQLTRSVRRAYFRFIVRDQMEAEARFYTYEEMMEMLFAAGFTQIIFKALRRRSPRDRVFSLIKAIK